MAEAKVALIVPKVPNFIRVNSTGTLDVKLDIAGLSDEELIELAEEWKNELLNLAAKRRK